MFRKSENVLSSDKMVKSRVILKDCAECDRDRNGDIVSKSCNSIGCANNDFHDKQMESTYDKVFSIKFQKFQFFFQIKELHQRPLKE